MTAPAEIELKLVATRGSPVCVTALFSGVRFAAAPVQTVYFDTADDTLRRHGMALRLRRDGERWIQTLKTAARAAALVAERGEWEFELDVPDGRPLIDLARFAHTPLQALLDAGLEPGALAPRFETSFIRRRATIHYRDSILEVAIDLGEVRARGARDVVRRPITEVELELKSGKAADLLRLALRTVRSADAVLVPALLSKADRGHALARSAALPVARASAEAFSNLLPPSATSGAALRTVVGRALAILIANADGLREAPLPEHVHQARVALRRIRSTIRLLDPEGVDVPRGMLKDLRWLARKLGDARDWDVIVQAVLPEIAASASTQVATDLARRTERLRQKARDSARAAVSSRRYARLALACAMFAVSAPPAADRSLEELARSLAEALADEALARARSFPRLSLGKQHRVRIRTKRLRYALDLLRDLLPTADLAEYIEALAQLQDALGKLNDAAVAWDRLQHADPESKSRKAIRAWHAKVEPALARAAGRQLLAMARRARPWRPSGTAGR